MREIIKSVIASEMQAKGLVAAARVEADRIATDAQKKGQDLVMRVRAEARTEAERMVEAAVRNAEREKEEYLARVTAEIGTEVQLEEGIRQRAVAAVVRCVCGQHQP